MDHPYRFYHLQKHYLLLVAGLVWAAGFHILRIGLLATDSPWSLLTALAFAVIFCLFYFLIFRRMVGRHQRRIAGYRAARMHILRFFDVKSYLYHGFYDDIGHSYAQAGANAYALYPKFLYGVGRGPCGRQPGLFPLLWQGPLQGCAGEAVC